MRKYAFRKDDVVRARSVIVGRSVDGEKIVMPEDGKTVVGRVIGFGSSAGHDWYKVAYGGDVYNCRDDELELIRREPAGREIPPIGENEIERFLLIWRPMSMDPPKDEECAVVWTTPRGARRVSVMRWTGEDWAAEDVDGDEYHINRDVFTAWALWEYPEIDQKSDGEEDVSDEVGADADPDDGQAGD